MPWNHRSTSTWYAALDQEEGLRIVEGKERIFNRPFKQPEAGCGACRSRFLHGHGEQSRHVRRAGSHHGPGCQHGHRGHDLRHHGQHRS